MGITAAIYGLICDVGIMKDAFVGTTEVIYGLICDVGIMKDASVETAELIYGLICDDVGIVKNGRVGDDKSNLRTDLR